MPSGCHHTAITILAWRARCTRICEICSLLHIPQEGDAHMRARVCVFRVSRIPCSSDSSTPASQPHRGRPVARRKMCAADNDTIAPHSNDRGIFFSCCCCCLVFGGGDVGAPARLTLLWLLDMFVTSSRVSCVRRQSHTRVCVFVRVCM